MWQEWLQYWNVLLKTESMENDLKTKSKAWPIHILDS